MDIVAMIQAVAGAVGRVFGWAQQRDTEKNQAPIVAGKMRVQDQSAVDRVNVEIKKGDIDAIRKDLAE